MSSVINTILFETVYIQDLSLTRLISTVAYHPLLVTPSSIEYNDASRTSIRQSLSRINSQKSGRRPLQCTLSGMFGVKPRFTQRGMVGGFQRLLSFWREAVRLGDAVSKHEAKKCFDYLSMNNWIWMQTGMPDAFDEESGHFEVNFYDFINNQKFRCNINNFRLSETTAKEGLPTYVVQIEELGDVLIGDTMVDSAIDKAFEVEGLVDGGIDILQSNKPQNYLNLYQDTVVAAKQIISDISDEVTSYFDWNTRGDLVSAVGGKSQGAGSARNADQYGERYSEETTEDIIGQVRERASIQKVNDKLQGWQDQIDVFYEQAYRQVQESKETVSIIDDETPAVAPMDFSSFVYDTLQQKEEMEYLKNSYKYGHMTEQEYLDQLALIENQRDNASFIPTHTIEHRIKRGESIFDIAEVYGLSPQFLMEFNGIRSEGLRGITTIRIPIPDSRRVAGIDGLPVAGTHQGYEALGRDLSNTLEIDSDDDLVALEPIDTIAQDADNIIQDFSDFATKDLDDIPEIIREQVLKAKLETMLLQDPRIISADITVTAGTNGYSIRANPVRTITSQLRKEERP